MRDLGILVTGDNHFIVRGPKPDAATARALVAHWTWVTIGRRTPPELEKWRISTREFREELEWAVVAPGEGEHTVAVAALLDELRGRGVVVERV